LALTLLGGVIGLPIVGASVVSARRAGLTGTPPYPLPSAVGRNPEGDPWDPARDLPGPTALLYVSERCPHCRAELATWASVAGSVRGRVALRIVASPSSERRALAWVPEALRGRVFGDPGGAIAEALGVRAVPVTLWIDSTGVVRGQRVGRLTPSEIEEWLGRLGGFEFDTTPRPTAIGDPP
jgi:hypothetical protein